MRSARAPDLGGPAPSASAAPSPWCQAAVLARGTWRLAWREPLSRLLLALAVLLAVVGSAAAVGSPTAGDGAVQMLAVCLQVVPFALVLLAGDIWRRDVDEAALSARALDGMTYVAGRAAGLCLVGLALLAAAAAVSAMGLWAVARLPAAAAVGWLTLLSAVAVAPGVVLLAGACLWWLARGGAGPRYHAAVLLGTLLLAFYSYKIDALAAQGALRWLTFFAPFPGLLTLGLALPPAALGAPPVPGWLWLNRALFLCLGLALLALAARRRGAGLGLFPLRSQRVWRGLLAATLIGAAAAGVPLAVAARRLAPAVLPALPQLRGVVVPAANSLSLSLAVDAASGRLRGSATWTLARPAVTVYLLLNAGLRLHAPPGATWTERGGGALVPGTAARLYRLRLVRGASALRLGFAGRLLPVPSALPYPPFPLAQPFEGAAAGGGRLFLDGRGTWYPLPVGAGLRPASPVRAALRLVVSRGSGAWWGVPARGRAGVLRVDWIGSRLPSVVGALVPYGTFTGPGWTLAGERAPAPAAARALTTYARAVRALHPVDAALFPSPQLRAVAVPLLTRPLWSEGMLWLPADQPFCRPLDPVTGACAGPPPTPVTAALLLSDLAWGAHLGAVADALVLPWPAAVRGLAWSVAPEAVVTAWRAVGSPTALQAAWTRGAALPGLGRLTAAQRALAAHLASAG